MKDVFDINFSEYISTYISPSKEIEKHGETLLEITDLREKLEYYNQHICSVSFPLGDDGLHCYGEYDNHHGSGKIFFTKAQEKLNSPDFDIYWEIRQSEIQRLKGLICSTDNYLEKLKFFIEHKAGQFRYDYLTVKSNEWEKFIANGGGTTPPSLYGHNNEIDLKPATPEETKKYNLYLLEYVVQLTEKPFQFHRLVEDKYDRFLCEPAIRTFTSQLDKALNKEVTISNELKRIESKFSVGYLIHYIEILYPYTISNLFQWQSALLNALINGHEYDFSRRQLSVHETKALFHVTQIFEYYKLLLELKTNNNNSTSFSDRQPFRNSVTDTKIVEWQGTMEQKDLLFDELVDHSFVDSGFENKKKFLNNAIIKWKSSGRDLFYLIEELKTKRLKLLPLNLELSPFIRLNFTDNKGKTFKNINQNKSGISNINKNQKPKGGRLIVSL